MAEGHYPVYLFTWRRGEAVLGLYPPPQEYRGELLFRVSFSFLVRVEMEVEFSSPPAEPMIQIDRISLYFSSGLKHAYSDTVEKFLKEKGIKAKVRLLYNDLLSSARLTLEKVTDTKYSGYIEGEHILGVLEYRHSAWGTSLEGDAKLFLRLWAGTAPPELHTDLSRTLSDFFKDEGTKKTLEDLIGGLITGRKGVEGDVSVEIKDISLSLVEIKPQLFEYSGLRGLSHLEKVTFRLKIPTNTFSVWKEVLEERGIRSFLGLLVGFLPLFPDGVVLLDEPKLTAPLTLSFFGFGKGKGSPKDLLLSFAQKWLEIL